MNAISRLYIIHLTPFLTQVLKFPKQNPSGKELHSLWACCPCHQEHCCLWWVNADRLSHPELRPCLGCALLLLPDIIPGCWVVGRLPSQDGREGSELLLWHSFPPALLTYSRLLWAGPGLWQGGKWCASDWQMCQDQLGVVASKTFVRHCAPPGDALLPWSSWELSKAPLGSSEELCLPQEGSSDHPQAMPAGSWKEWQCWGFSPHPSQFCNSTKSQWIAVAGLLNSAHVRSTRAPSSYPQAWFASCSHINELFIDFLKTADFSLKHKYFQVLKDMHLKIKKE